MALKTYKHLPYTFVYLFAFFFLADVSIVSSELVGLTARPSGIQYYYHARGYLSKRPIRLLVFRQYVSWFGAIHTFNLQCTRILVCATPLEDQYEENGLLLLSSLLVTVLIVTFSFLSPSW